MKSKEFIGRCVNKIFFPKSQEEYCQMPKKNVEFFLAALDSLEK